MNKGKSDANLSKRNFLKENDGRSGRKIRDKKLSTIRTHWQSMSADERNLPGALLMVWLLDEANNRNMLLKDMAKELNVKYGYINQLRCGIRGIDQISDTFAGDCARFLRRPRLQILIASGRLSLKDYFSDERTIEDKMNEALVFMSMDELWGAYIDSDMFDVKLEIKYLVIRLFEKSTGKRLLKETYNPVNEDN